MSVGLVTNLTLTGDEGGGGGLVEPEARGAHSTVCKNVLSKCSGSLWYEKWRKLFWNPVSVNFDWPCSVASPGLNFSCLFPVPCDSFLVFACYLCVSTPIGRDADQSGDSFVVSSELDEFCAPVYHITRSPARTPGGRSAAEAFRYGHFVAQSTPNAMREVKVLVTTVLFLLQVPSNAQCNVTHQIGNWLHLVCSGLCLASHVTCCFQCASRSVSRTHAAVVIVSVVPSPLLSLFCWAPPPPPLALSANRTTVTLIHPCFSMKTPKTARLLLGLMESCTCCCCHCHRGRLFPQTEYKNRSKNIYNPA